ncbi:MAG: S26 family signal peptidase [Alphaproteobacteria bacterium]
MMRRTWSLVGAAAIAVIALPAFVDLPTAIIWNASPSAPIGFYQVRSTERLEVSNLVVVDPPEALERFVIERGYLPPDIPLLKRVVGLPGQTVCRIDRSITVDGTLMGAALDRDSFGRPMPVWRGCHRIATDEVFLMNRDARNSLDGRYFGPIPASSIIGSAISLWTIEPGTGRYRWRVGKQ